MATAAGWRSRGGVHHGPEGHMQLPGRQLPGKRLRRCPGAYGLPAARPGTGAVSAPRESPHWQRTSGRVIVARVERLIHCIYWLAPSTTLRRLLAAWRKCTIPGPSRVLWWRKTAQLCSRLSEGKRFPCQGSSSYRSVHLLLGAMGPRPRRWLVKKNGWRSSLSC